MHHITRVDRNSLHKHLWQVTVRRWNRVYTRSFSDRRHGGREQALAAAQGYRDSILAQQAPMPRRTRCAVLKRNNRSGRSISLLGGAMAGGWQDHQTAKIFHIQTWRMGRVSEGRCGEAARSGDHG